MNHKKIYLIISKLIAMVWLLNGLFCKVLNLMPRHELIVARILGSAYSRQLTLMIGVSEIAIAVCIWSGIKSKLNALIQIGIIATMNAIEFFMAPDLLLWGKANALFAGLLILLIYWNEFILNKKRSPQN